MYTLSLQRWELTPPKVLGTIFDLIVTSLMLHATLAEHIQLSRTITVATMKASFFHHE